MIRLEKINIIFNVIEILVVFIDLFIFIWEIENLID